MKVLVACEFSGIVRDAFRRRGHDAWSCDLLPCERDPQWHIQGDVLPHLADGWDLMIAHPPCTYLTVAANGWHKKRPERAPLREAALAFFIALYNAPVPRVCVENPVGIVSSRFRKPDQIVQPHWFGNPQRKATCFWLRNLPPLEHRETIELFGGKTHVEPEAVMGVSPKGKKYYSMNWLPQSDERWRIRSRTFQGIADAMAEQWGSLT
jgi:hypothetical protein